MEKNINIGNLPDVCFDSPYYFNGKPVPRVTNILSAMLHEEYLMNWAEKMGRFNVDRNEILENAASIGSAVHEWCENFLRYRMVPDFSNTPRTKRNMKMINAFNSFMTWIYDLEANHIWKPVMMEVPLVNELYGGTLDALLEIDGRLCIIDFKTSNQMSYKYVLQVIAYRYTLREVYGINVDRLYVLRFNKTKVEMPEELLLDLEKPDVLEFANNCENMFLALVYAYYNRNMVENYYKYFTGSERI